jgi:hypothetical protein
MLNLKVKRRENGMKAKLAFQARKCVPTGTPCLHPLPNSSEARIQAILKERKVTA